MKKSNSIMFVAVFAALFSLLFSSCRPEPLYPPKPPVNDAVIDLTVSDITDVSFTYSAKPKDKATRYLLVYSSLSFYNEMGGDAGAVDAFMEQQRQIAEIKGVEFEKYLSEMVYTGDFTEKIEDLDPATDYVVFAWGVDDKYAKNTDLYTVRFTTLPLQKQNLDFQISVTDIKPTGANFTIIPSDADATYFCFTISEQELNDDYAGNNYTQVVEDIKNGYLLEGYQTPDIVKSFAKRGEYSGVIQDLDPATKYHVFAVGVNSSFMPNSDVKVEMFTTVDMPRSDIKFTINVMQVSELSLKAKIEVSNQDKYLWTIIEADSVVPGAEMAMMKKHIAKLKSTQKLDASLVSGNIDIDYKGLKPGVKYSLVAFAYNLMPVSDLARADFSSLPLEGDAKQLSFVFQFVEQDGAKAVKIIPSVKQCYYFDIMTKERFDKISSAGNPAIALGQYFQADLSFYASEAGVAPEDYVYTSLYVGDTVKKLENLEPGVQYVVYALAINPKTMLNVSDMVFTSEPFDSNVSSTQTL